MKAEYAGTRFHHFMGIATIAVRQSPNSELLSIGLALLALPRYYNPSRPRHEVAHQDLCDAYVRLDEVIPGDQYSRPKGRAISHGRALNMGAMSGLHQADKARSKLIELRTLERTLPRLTSHRGGANSFFQEDFLELIAARSVTQEMMVRLLVRGEN